MIKPKCVFKNFFKKRKGEDGRVDNSFYDWHYLGLYLPTPMVTTGINSQVFVTIIPQSTFVTPPRLELWTPLVKSQVLYQLSYEVVFFF